MYDLVKSLANSMMAKESKLQIAFNENAVDRNKNEYLEFGGKRLGPDFDDYARLAANEGTETAALAVLTNMVLPLKRTAPQAFAAGLAFIEERAGEVSNRPEVVTSVIKSVYKP